MFEMFVTGKTEVFNGGYMICDPLGVQKAIIKDGAFAEKVVEALNWESEHSMDRTQEEYEADIDELNESINDLREELREAQNVKVEMEKALRRIRDLAEDLL